MKCALLSNIESIARQMGRHEVHIARGYGVWTQELADPASETFRFAPSSVFLIIDGAELLRALRAKLELQKPIHPRHQFRLHPGRTTLRCRAQTTPARGVRRDVR
jgi:hypothetical protein